MTDPFESVRAANPVPEGSAPPIEMLWERLEQRGHRPDRRAWRGLGGVIAILSSVIAIAVAAVILISVHADKPRESASSPARSPIATSRAAACRASAHVQPRVLPVWARSGFSDPKHRMPYLLGRARKIAVILWADPLRSPPPKDHNNKILWVARAPTNPGSDLRIAAQLMSGTTAIGAPVVRRVIGGPGPSIINLPTSGCWRLTLRWSHVIDAVDLRYVGSR